MENYTQNKLHHKIKRWSSRHPKFLTIVGVLFTIVYMLFLAYIVLTGDFSNIQDSILNFPGNVIMDK